MNFLSRLIIIIFLGKGIHWLINLLMMVGKNSLGIGLLVSIMGLEDMILFRYSKHFVLVEILGF